MMVSRDDGKVPRSVHGTVVSVKSSPAVRRAGRSFATELDRLGWLLRVLKRRTSRSLQPTRLTPDNIDVFVVCTAWVRLGISYATAAHRIAVAGLADAAFPTERALLEVWAEFKYLLNCGDATENAHRVAVTAVLELADFLERDGSTSKPDTAGVFRQIVRLERDHPETFAAVKLQRTKRRFHWSGQSRSAVIKATMVDMREVYGVLSWDAHPLMTAIRDVTNVPAAEERAASIQFMPLALTREAANELAFRVGGMVYYLWNEYAERFGLPGIRAPK